MDSPYETIAGVGILGALSYLSISALKKGLEIRKICDDKKQQFSPSKIQELIHIAQQHNVPLQRIFENVEVVKMSDDIYIVKNIIITGTAFSDSPLQSHFKKEGTLQRPNLIYKVVKKMKNSSIKSKQVKAKGYKTFAEAFNRTDDYSVLYRKEGYDFELSKSLSVADQDQKKTRIPVKQFVREKDQDLKFGCALLNHYQMEKKGVKQIKKVLELGMTIGAPISILGNITVNISENKIRIDNPLIQAANKAGIQHYLNEKSNSQILIGVCWAAVGVIGFGLHRVYKNQQKKKQLKQKEQQKEQEQEREQEIKQVQQQIIQNSKQQGNQSQEQKRLQSES